MSDSESENMSDDQDRESENMPEDQDPETTNGDMWDIMIADTAEKHSEQLKSVLHDTDSFKRKFQKYFLENSRKWLHKMHDFFENDTLREKLWQIMENIDDAEDVTEALNIAIDQKKYKILKLIDWSQVINLLQSEDEAEAEIDNNEDGQDDDHEQEVEIGE